MDYLQRLVFQAMSKSPEHDESYAHEFALGKSVNPLISHG